MVAMQQIVHPTHVEVVGPHLLRLRFEDGVEADLDFSTREWPGIFEPLADPDYFALVRVDDELGTITWPNGADIAPETLHAWACRVHAPA